MLSRLLKMLLTSTSIVINKLNLNTLVANLKAARLGLKPAATHQEVLMRGTSAAVESRPELVKTEEIPFEIVKKENLTFQQKIRKASLKVPKVNVQSISPVTTETV